MIQTQQKGEKSKNQLCKRKVIQPTVCTKTEFARDLQLSLSDSCEA